MRQSIVVKARVDDMEKAENAIFDLTESLGTFFVQEDVYFNVPNGNLKLRIMHPNRCGQLIYSSLSEKSDHKLSESQVTEVEDVLSIRVSSSKVFVPFNHRFVLGVLCPDSDD
ncbi:unnamed protein product [Haemonchus placei]|uniref:CYTH domain-containing protein n=1 Tax=Haemonchus placei TaxID=6290 RepID=A0A0N4VYV4_HAEPC|nr:unnamed protein product [Haemonchus placei]